MVTRVCVLKSGGEYLPSHVQWLARQVPGLVCLSDVDVRGVPSVPLNHNWPGWWSKLELFSGSVAGDLLYFDLDTVIVGELSAFEQVEQTTFLSDFYWPDHPATGLMYIAEADKESVWQTWLTAPDCHMQKRRGRGAIGDQGFLSEVLKPARWQDQLPGAVVSYKVHCRQALPPEAKIVCFHGQPRPWNISESWVPRYG